MVSSLALSEDKVLRPLVLGFRVKRIAEKSLRKKKYNGFNGFLPSVQFFSPTARWKALRLNFTERPLACLGISCLVRQQSRKPETFLRLS